MSFTGSSAWKADAFSGDREAHAQMVRQQPLPQFVRVKETGPNEGWILFGPQDVRDAKPRYNFALQYLKCDKTLRVRVGCRFKTLPQAWKHWGVHHGKNRGTYRRNECEQAVVIIRLMIAQAKAYHLLPMFGKKANIKFDASLLKPKRKS